MAPYDEQREILNMQSNIQLMQGDCLERMKEIPSGSVDLTVTSPLMITCVHTMETTLNGQTMFGLSASKNYIELQSSAVL